MVVTHSLHYLHNNYQFSQQNQSVPLNFLTANDICIPDDNLNLSGSELERAFFTLIFPPLCLIGIVGNCLNLIVLLNSDAKKSSYHRSNRLLVALAFCDILFLIVIIPHSLANYDFFGLNNTFRFMYFTLKMHLIALANFLSGITIWLVIAISAERLLGIRSLIQANPHWSKCTTAHVIGIIVLISALLNFYNNVSHHCIIKYLCNNTQVISKCFNIQDDWPGNQSITSPAIRTYVRWSIFLNIIFIVFIPIIIILLLNVALLMVVRRQSFLMYNRLTIENSIYKKQKNGSTEVVANPISFRRSIDQTSQFNAERRVSIVVVAVVSCFVVTQGPSAVVLLIGFLYGQKPLYVTTNQWYNISTVTGFLVILGKTLNFILFCLSSSSFRRRLVKIISRKHSFIANSSGAHIQESLRKYSVQGGVRFSVPHDF